MAVVLWVTAVGLLVISVLLGEGGDSPWLQVVVVVTQSAGALGLLLAALYSVRNWLRRWAEGQLMDLTGPALIRSMAPRAVLGSLLPRIYGERVDHEEILTGILGGAGRDAADGDTAVSRGTDAHFRIETVSDTQCISYLTSTHEYVGIRNNHLFMIFATSDRQIARLVTSERIYPLHELWILEEEDLEDFVPSLRETLRVGIRYVDQEGTPHVIAPRPYHGEEVAFRHYDQYIRLPDHLDRKNLRIVQLDLHDLADDDHVVTSVETLTVTVSNVAAFDLGYLVWSPPHPCFVRAVSFDVSGLARAGENLVYLVVVATIKGAGMPVNTWKPLPDRIHVPVASWMLPGHNITLLYRPMTAAELPDAPQSS